LTVSLAGRFDAETAPEFVTGPEYENEYIEELYKRDNYDYVFLAAEDRTVYGSI
jgi:hypothetical protein